MPELQKIRLCRNADHANIDTLSRVQPLPGREEELFKLSEILSQIEADREALFVSRSPPLSSDAEQSTQFFNDLSAITARYRSFERQCQEVRKASLTASVGIRLVHSRSY